MGSERDIEHAMDGVDVLLDHLVTNVFQKGSGPPHLDPRPCERLQEL